jgi:LysM repeat protein
MYFNYDNDKKVYVVPMLPEKIKITVKGKTTSIDIDRFGEIIHKGKREGMVISFSSFFPATYGSNYCACLKKEFRKPSSWHKWMISLQNASKPCHFVLENAPFAINIYADITSYTGTEEGGDVGTISYSVELKEHRTPEIKTYKKTSKTKKTTSSGKRTNNKSKTKTYTVKKGDTLQKIARKYKTTSSKLYKKNKTVIEKAAKKHGKSSSNKGWWIYPGTKLAIP